jgi:type 1 glutamine amidotransferase
MRALVICDDFYHSGDVAVNGLSFLEDVCTFDYLKDMTEIDVGAEIKKGYDAIILAKSEHKAPSDKSSWITDEAERCIVDYVDSGGGLLVMHAGAVACQAKLLREVVGCKFSWHPIQCPVDFQIVAENEITKGASDFSEKDEHYFVDFRAENADLFMTSRSPNGLQPAGFTLNRHKGRICVLTPGHNLPVWENKQYQIIIKNALNWCAEGAT